MKKADPAFAKMALGYGLTTAEIFYHMPDHRDLLQVFVWQDYDLYPKFPQLKKFLTFWGTLDGPLHSVRIAHSRLIRPAELKLVEAEFLLN